MSRQALNDEMARLQRQVAAWQQLVDKLKRIRALHVTAYSAHVPVEKTSVEFFYCVGDVLEGLKPEELKLSLINRSEFLKELEDG
jgi:hypothetical protein